MRGQGAPQITGLDDKVIDFLGTNRFAGATVAASKAGRLVWSKGYGYANTADTLAMEPWHRSRIGSVSKLITCVAALKLVEDGRLSLDSPVYSLHTGSTSARHGLTSAQYQRAFASHAEAGFRLTHVSGYGSGSDTRYAAIWERRPGPAWRARHGLTSAQYQAAFTDNARDGYRLTHVSGYGSGSDTRYAAIWERRPGPAWRARHGLTNTQYQQEFDQNTGDGFRLVHVDGNGSGSSARLSAIWERDPGAQPGVLRDRAYTEALLERYVDDPGQAARQTAVLLRRAGDLRIRHLLSHTGGFIKSGSAARAAEHLGIDIDDMTYREAHIGVLAGAVSDDGPFLFDPGTDRAYSNHGFGLSGFIVSEVAGVPYVDYVREEILHPAGIDHIVPYGWDVSERDSARHALEDDEPSPLAHGLRPGAKLAVATGGWAATAEDMVRFMCTLDRLSTVPDVLGSATVQLMETVAYPQADSDQPLGWDARVARADSAGFHKNGRTTGGTASVSRFLPGFISTTGVDLSEINVAVCVNQFGSSAAVRSLSNEVARACGAADVPDDFDLFG